MGLKDRSVQYCPSKVISPIGYALTIQGNVTQVECLLNSLWGESEQPPDLEEPFRTRMSHCNALFVYKRSLKS